MRIFVSGSQTNAAIIPAVKIQLEMMGYEVVLPDDYNDSEAEKRAKMISHGAYERFKAKALRNARRLINSCDVILVLNVSNHKGEHYVGGTSFIDMYNAYCNGVSIYLYEEIPQGNLYDEIESFSPIVINKDLSRIKNFNWVEITKDCDCAECPAFDELTEYCTVNGNCHLKGAV